MSIYPEFTWWQGVVEDRNDPAKLGRVRVRILGYHTSDKTQLPTSDLPLAVLMQTPTSAGVSGIGQSSTGLVEGSHVMGFFADGPDGQIPVIMGSFAALSMQPPNKDLGFNDPNGKYPLSKNDGGRNTVPESDQPRLAREDVSEKSLSLAVKRNMRVDKVPIAFAPIMGTEDNPVDKQLTGRYTESFWSEPHPQGNETTQTVYPYNHVKETESGHVFEVDDTPGAERIHNFHKAGTFEEIQPDGTKVTKVVGEDYDIVIKDRNMFIKGNMNITVEGDMTLNVKGDYYEDITGNKYSIVRGNNHTKTQGNNVNDVMSDYSMNISGSRGVTVNCEGSGSPGSDTELIRGKRTQTISNDSNIIVGGKTIQSSNNGYDISTLFGNYAISTTGLKGPTLGGNIELRTPALNSITMATGTYNLGASVAANFGNATNPITSLNTNFGVAVTTGGAYTITTAAYVGTHASVVVSGGTNITMTATVINLN